MIQGLDRYRDHADDLAFDDPSQALDVLRVRFGARS